MLRRARKLSSKDTVPSKIGQQHQSELLLRYKDSVQVIMAKGGVLTQTSDQMLGRAYKWSSKDIVPSQIGQYHRNLASIRITIKIQG
jgi:hypothetical protein